MRAEELIPDHLNSAEVNGVEVRKGTVGAFLVNARVFCDETASAADRDTSQTHMHEALPALRALGLFEIFELKDDRLRALMSASDTASEAP
jgi:hypothetical protein